MEMTFDQYISNPMGIKNAVFSNREMYRTLYTEKLDKILVREVGKINYSLYYSDDKYYAYFKIPSEVVPNFYYDVVIEFYSDDSRVSKSDSLKDYKVKFFSNDPSFVFTFAHAFISNKLFIKDLTPRMTKQAVKKVAKEKNPTNQVGYVKSIYFAYLTMRRYGLFYKIKYKSEGSKYNKKELLNLVEDSDTKIESRQIEGEKIRQENRAKKLEQKKNNINTNNVNRFNNQPNTPNRTGAVRKTATVGTVGRVGRTKTVNKIGKSKLGKRF